MITVPLNFPDAWDVESYHFAINVDFEAEEVSGTSTLYASRVTAGEMLLHLDGPVIDAVRVGDASGTTEFSDWSIDEEGLHLAISESLTDVVVEVDYHGGSGTQYSSADPSSGFGLQWGNQHLYAQNEPNGARHWLVTDDTPDDRASVSWEITVPAGMRAVGVGELVGVVENGDTATWSWALEEAIPSYLMVLQAGNIDYEVIEGSVDVWVWAPPAQLDDAVDQMGVAHDELEWMAEWLAPYPYPHFGVGFVDQFAFGGMENPTLTTLNDDYLSSSYDLELLVMHEMAHHWFGDLVTIEQWDDFWLNEGFATYVELLWEDERGTASPEQYVAYFETYIGGGYVNDTPLNDANGSFPEFGVYFKGAACLHMLRRELGDDAFFTLLNRWVEENAYTAVTTADFVALTSDVAGRPMDDWFSPWLDQSNSPGLEIRFGQSEFSGGYQFELTIEQAGIAYAMDYPITLELADGTVESHLVRIDSESVALTFCFDQAVRYVGTDELSEVYDPFTKRKTLTVSEITCTAGGDTGEVDDSGGVDDSGTPADTDEPAQIDEEPTYEGSGCAVGEGGGLGLWAVALAALGLRRKR